MSRLNLSALIAIPALFSIIVWVMLSEHQVFAFFSDTKSNASLPVTQQVRRQYAPAEIDYFMEIALGAEFGNSTPKIKKWVGQLKVKVIGSPTVEDLKTLNKIVEELTSFANIDIRFDDTNPNVEIYFVPESDFSRYEPNYIPTNMGFFWTWWDNWEIVRSRIMISTVNITQKERSHLIREEFTQSLGLMNDSYNYPESIFYQSWTNTTEYADIDKAIIKMLYQPEIRVGMTKKEVQNVLNAR